MLASLLPGLRELRAPLAAGYLWLLVGWLVFHHRVETGPNASDSVDALLQLQDEMGPAGLAAAATFVAYLVGALWQPVAETLSRALWKVLRGSNPTRTRADEVEMTTHKKRIDYYIEQAAERREAGVGSWPPRHWRMSAAAWAQLAAGARRLSRDVDEELIRRLGLSDEAIDKERSKLDLLLSQNREGFQKLRGLVEADRSNEIVEMKIINARSTLYSKDPEFATSIQAMDLGSERDRWWIREARELARGLLVPSAEAFDRKLHAAVKTTQATDVKFVDEAAMCHQLYLELPLTANRLVGEQQELFLEVSRMKGETEFRTLVALPVAAVIGVVTFGLGLHLWLWAICLVAGLALCGALIADSWARDRRRNDFLVSLLATKQAKSPTFDRLLERAKATSLAEEAREPLPAHEPPPEPGDPVLQPGRRHRARSNRTAAG